MNGQYRTYSRGTDVQTKSITTPPEYKTGRSRLRQNLLHRDRYSRSIQGDGRKDLCSNPSSAIRICAPYCHGAGMCAQDAVSPAPPILRPRTRRKPPLDHVSRHRVKTRDALALSSTEALDEWSWVRRALRRRAVAVGGIKEIQGGLTDRGSVSLTTDGSMQFSNTMPCPGCGDTKITPSACGISSVSRPVGRPPGVVA